MSKKDLEAKKLLLKQVEDVKNDMLLLLKSGQHMHIERLSVNEIKKYPAAMETIYILREKSINLPSKKEKFKIGDYVAPNQGCNKGIPCKVVDTYFPDYEGAEQYITVVPLRKSDILKGHTASRLKQNKYTASWRVFKFLSTFKDGKTGIVDPRLYILENGEYKPILDENGNHMMKEEINGTD